MRGGVWHTVRVRTMVQWQHNRRRVIMLTLLVAAAAIIVLTGSAHLLSRGSGSSGSGGNWGTLALPGSRPQRWFAKFRGQGPVVPGIDVEEGPLRSKGLVGYARAMFGSSFQTSPTPCVDAVNGAAGGAQAPGAHGQQLTRKQRRDPPRWAWIPHTPAGDASARRLAPKQWAAASAAAASGGGASSITNASMPQRDAPSHASLPPVHGRGGSTAPLELLLHSPARRIALLREAATLGHSSASTLDAAASTDGSPVSLSWTLTPRQACDAELLLNGGFTPLVGYMDMRTYESVLADMRLPVGYGGDDGAAAGAVDAGIAAADADGDSAILRGGGRRPQQQQRPRGLKAVGVAAPADESSSPAGRRGADSPATTSTHVVGSGTGALWPMPITLDVPTSIGSRLSRGSKLFLRDAYFNLIAVLTVSDVWTPNKRAEALAVFGTVDDSHPGVALLLRDSHPVYVGGRLEGVDLPSHMDYAELRHTPSALRAEILARGWARTVAFQTRNPMHRAHIELTRLAATEARAGLLLQPVVGVTKPGDIDAAVRIRCYLAVLASSAGYYDPSGAMLSLLPLAMRMGGPREALWHAIIRKNYGATHFIVGRDHAGVKDRAGKDFFGPYAAQDLVAKHAAELGIVMMAYKEVEFVPSSGEFLPSDRIPQGAVTASISGTEFRKLMNAGAAVPAWYSDPGVISVLRTLMPPLSSRGFVLFFTGLSGSGKTTIVSALAGRLASLAPTRRVTLLDGDVVRTHLSKGLGFSIAARNTNVERIGWVAAEVARGGGIVIASAISPFQSSRDAAKAFTVGSGGGGSGSGAGWFTVHVATAIGTCAARDVKGLYFAAAATAASSATAAAAATSYNRSSGGDSSSSGGSSSGGGALPAPLDLTGVTHPWEFPVRPDVVIDTDAIPDVRDAVTLIIGALVHAGYIVGHDSSGDISDSRSGISGSGSMGSSGGSGTGGGGGGAAASASMALFSDNDAPAAAAAAAATAADEVEEVEDQLQIVNDAPLSVSEALLARILSTSASTATTSTAATAAAAAGSGSSIELLSALLSRLPIGPPSDESADGTAPTSTSSDGAGRRDAPTSTSETAQETDADGERYALTSKTSIATHREMLLRVYPTLPLPRLGRPHSETDPTRLRCTPLWDVLSAATPTGGGGAAGAPSTSSMLYAGMPVSTSFSARALQPTSEEGGPGSTSTSESSSSSTPTSTSIVPASLVLALGQGDCGTYFSQLIPALLTATDALDAAEASAAAAVAAAAASPHISGEEQQQDKKKKKAAQQHQQRHRRIVLQSDMLHGSLAERAAAIIQQQQQYAAAAAAAAEVASDTTAAAVEAAYAAAAVEAAGAAPLAFAYPAWGLRHVNSAYLLAVEAHAEEVEGATATSGGPPPSPLSGPASTWAMRVPPLTSDVFTDFSRAFSVAHCYNGHCEPSTSTPSSSGDVPPTSTGGRRASSPHAFFRTAFAADDGGVVGWAAALNAAAAQVEVDAAGAAAAEAQVNSGQVDPGAAAVAGADSAADTAGTDGNKAAAAEVGSGEEQHEDTVMPSVAGDVVQAEAGPVAARRRLLLLGGAIVNTTGSGGVVDGTADAASPVQNQLLQQQRKAKRTLHLLHPQRKQGRWDAFEMQLSAALLPSGLSLASASSSSSAAASSRGGRSGSTPAAGAPPSSASSYAPSAFRTLHSSGGGSPRSSSGGGSGGGSDAVGVYAAWDIWTSLRWSAHPEHALVRRVSPPQATQQQLRGGSQQGQGQNQTGQSAASENDATAAPAVGDGGDGDRGRRRRLLLLPSRGQQQQQPQSSPQMQHYQRRQERAQAAERALLLQAERATEERVLQQRPRRLQQQQQLQSRPHSRDNRKGSSGSGSSGTTTSGKKRTTSAAAPPPRLLLAYAQPRLLAHARHMLQFDPCLRVVVAVPVAIADAALQHKGGGRGGKKGEKGAAAGGGESDVDAAAGRATRAIAQQIISAWPSLSRETMGALTGGSSGGSDGSGSGMRIILSVVDGEGGSSSVVSLKDAGTAGTAAAATAGAAEGSSSNSSGGAAVIPPPPSLEALEAYLRDWHSGVMALAKSYPQRVIVVEVPEALV